MNALQQNKWRTIRKRGRVRFIWINGFLLWGIPSAFLFSMLMGAIWGKNLFTILVISLILFPLFGLYFGGSVWESNERRYSKTAM